MKIIFLFTVCATLTLASGAVAEGLSGTIDATIDGTPVALTVVSSATKNTPDPSGIPRLSGFAPGEDTYVGIDQLVIWSQPAPDSLARLMLAINHRVSGEPSFIDLFKGDLLYSPENDGTAWVANLGDPGSEIVIDSYSSTETLATVSGHFSVTAHFLPEDAEEPDLSQSLPISGSFAVTLPPQRDR
jgi:hypothetical protein